MRNFNILQREEHAAPTLNQQLIQAAHSLAEQQLRSVSQEMASQYSADLIRFTSAFSRYAVYGGQRPRVLTGPLGPPVPPVPPVPQYEQGFSHIGSAIPYATWHQPQPDYTNYIPQDQEYPHEHIPVAPSQPQIPVGHAPSQPQQPSYHTLETPTSSRRYQVPQQVSQQQQQQQQQQQHPQPQQPQPQQVHRQASASWPTSQRRQAGDDENNNSQ